MTGPKTEIERRYAVMIRRFLALTAGHRNPRRTRALARELDRTAALIGKKRAKVLDHWVLNTLRQKPRRRA
jgi:hypothetical protein